MKKAKSKSVIAVDVDDVLFPTNDGIREYVNKHFGTNLSHEDHTQPGEYIGYFERIWNVEHEEAEHRYQSFIQSGALVELEPIEGAIEAIKELEENYELVILSARHEDQVEMTHKWLIKHFPKVFSDVRFISGWYHGRPITKAEICHEIGAKYLIDDHVHHCNDAAKEGIKALLFSEYGWSKSQKLEPGVNRVKTWQDVLEYFNNERAKSV